MQANIGIIGTGTVGSGVIEIIKNNQELIKKRTGVEINIKKVCNKNIEKAKALIENTKIVANAEEIINDPEINIVLELIGGYDPAKDIILKSLKNKKHVVTANKAVIAKYGKEILETAKNNNVNIAFEAAVGASIPIIKTIKESYAADNITKIYGILNGTTNYILTRMEEGMSYKDALKKAQDLGFAEIDPEFDVEGKDAAQKLVILSRLAFNADIDDIIFTEGITKISKNDIRYAEELGYKIKLLAIAKKEQEIELRVHPTMIPKAHELASVKNELNAVYLIGQNTGKSMLYGKGAGKLPTATAVIADIIDIAKNKLFSENFQKQQGIYLKDIKKKDINKITSRYYLRYNVIDQPGVLAKVAKILGDNNISIAAVQQKEINKDVVPVIVITHEALEENIRKAIKEIDELEVAKEPTVVIRIENIE